MARHLILLPQITKFVIEYAKFITIKIDLLLKEIELFTAKFGEITKSHNPKSESN